MWKQIKFRLIFDDIDDNENLYGFGQFDENNNPIKHSEIICGCCGCTFPIDEVKILKVYSDWVDLTQYIQD